MSDHSIEAARLIAVRFLGKHDRLLWIFAMKLLQHAGNFSGAVESGHANAVENVSASRGARGIELLDHGCHAEPVVFAGLVADAPDNDAWVIAIAKNAIDQIALPPFIERGRAVVVRDFLPPAVK